MWQFLARNKQVAAMLGVLGVAAIVVIVLSTKGSSHYLVENQPEETDDISNDPHIFSTYTLPGEDRFMPSIGNGHVATNIFSDTVYMNGLYNGRKGVSRRARIPGYANIRLNSTLTHFPFKPVYSLDTRDGVFKVRVDRDRSIVTQRIYAHRFYTRAIVNQIQVVSKPHVDPNFMHHEIWIAVKLMPGPTSNDITFEDPIPEIYDGRTIWSSCGQTKETEDPTYQPLPVDVCVYWTSVPDHLVVPQHGSRVFTFAMTVDNNKTLAREELLQVLQEDGEELYQKHVEPWHQLYYQSGFDIEGNLNLSKIVNGIWYYFLSSLPSEESHQPLNRYFGLSPTGLARGGTFDDYEGHNFWDTEMWMFPSILLMYPQYAKVLLQYRLDNAYVAAQLAKLTGNKGYRYPWESAYTGVEVTQPCCPEVAEFQQHITGCISFAVRQYLATTRDEDWLKHGGCSIVTNIADFWASRAVINYNTGLYDIANVMGPDEDHSNITNSAFTNVVAGYSLYLAQYVACLCKSYYMAKDPDHWADIAWSLSLPYNDELDYHPQFKGYRRGESIKQADVVLLGFPLQYPMNRTTRVNDLSYYESVTRGSGPAMTWSMHTIGHLDLEDNLRAAQLFNKSYLGYVREPFKVWTELRRPNVGAVNFFTGMGGFLQTLVFGYAGVRVHLDRLEITRPQLPPEATKFRVRGIKYLGSNLTLEIEVKSTSLTVNSLDEGSPLVFYNGRYNVTLLPGMTVTLSGKGPFTIRASQWKDCKLPDDTIGQNYLRPFDS
ncbi:protein-glucosylgalactosylhydroxylysine glucosidase isoform X1 [Ostrinia furnacalis]|uniref:protein-glucosylgalactosylhydroxylysine glucosidase isoform X1 n=1 Tax=Ostrinia furnacalis TaxID=93504 RepID=UPI00103A66A2|nr:protein-glucosylgalactosylhydroxylysine glucosidase isoform X1 [Ostrinia furnacalis]